MSHYSNQLKLYRNAIGSTNSIEKAIYMTWIKDFLKQTKMKNNYKKQILDHNVKKFSFIIKANLSMFSSTKILI